jgi:RND family efflux transporter MFP subunit
MTRKNKVLLSAASAAALVALGATVAVRAANNDKPADPAPATASAVAVKPALTVTVATPQAGRWPSTVSANGSIAAWQEASIGAEAQGLRLTEVRVQVGDRVKRGQVLALLSADTLAADAAAMRAGVAEAEAVQAEAAANAERARQLQASGAISAQQIQQYVTAEATARARVTSLKAQLRAAEVRLAQTRIAAPDDGVISARMATVGAVVQPGQELFKLIRKEKLEWRAEVAAAELARIQPGQKVQVTPAGGAVVQGTVRTVAPTVDAATRNGVVYVDLAKSDAAKAGMFARGEFAVGERQGVTLPQSAVVLRDGFNWVFVLGANNRVAQQKVNVGSRVGERIEITGGLANGARVVAQGAGFLADGDTVRIAQ